MAEVDPHGRGNSLMTDIGGDLAASAAAFAGLVLVFLGAASASIESYEARERRAVVWRYRRRAWPAFAALITALAACFAGLWGKAGHCEKSVWTSAVLLAISALAIVLSGIQMLLEVG